MIWAILFLAAVLRVIKLDQSLWLDEAINVLAAKDLNLLEYLTKYPIGDFHPPGYFFILWIWTHLEVSGEVAVRFPSVIFGTLTIYLVYLLGKELFSEQSSSSNRKTELIAALLMALAPLHIYYSQEARMYALATFAVTLSMLFFIRLLNGRKWATMSFILSTILVLYSDYLAYLIIPAQLLYLIWIKSPIVKRFLWLVFVSLFSLLPWLPIFIKQLQTGQQTAYVLSGWANVVGGSSLKDLLLLPIKTLIGRISFSKEIYATIVLIVGMLYGFFIIRGLRKLNDQAKLLLSWIVIPIFLAFLITLFIPVFSYFRMIFVLPAVYLLIACGITTLQKKWFTLSLIFITMINIIFIGIYYLNPKFQREDWKAVVNYLSQKLDSDSVVVFHDNNIPAPFRYYWGVSTTLPGLNSVPAKESADISEKFSDKKKIYLVEYLYEITDPQKLLEKRLMELKYSKIETYNFNGVGFIHLYTK